MSSKKSQSTNPLGGRPKDLVWQQVTIINPKDARCKQCGMQIMNRVDKVKKHLKKCQGFIPGQEQCNAT